MEIENTQNTTFNESNNSYFNPYQYDNDGIYIDNNYSKWYSYYTKDNNYLSFNLDQYIEYSSKGYVVDKLIDKYLNINSNLLYGKAEIIFKDKNENMTKSEIVGSFSFNNLYLIDYTPSKFILIFDNFKSIINKDDLLGNRKEFSYNMLIENMIINKFNLY